MSKRDQARKRLEAYQTAVRELQYLADRIDALETRITSATAPLDQQAGWDGRYWGKSLNGKGWITTRNPEELVNPRKVMQSTRRTKKDLDPKGGEKLLAALIDQQLEYEQKALETIELCQTIEAEIDAVCTGNEGTALKYRYLTGLTYEAIARKMDYSESHVRRLVSDAFTQFAKNMSTFGGN